MATFPILTSLLLGVLTIVDPCTLFASITAIGYIDKEITNKRAVIEKGLYFGLGKILTYILLAIPFFLGMQTSRMQLFLGKYGEPFLAIFLILCGAVLFFAGHHHDHDDQVNKWIQKLDGKNANIGAFILGILFAVVFCPHRLIYFITMINIMLEQSIAWSWLLPIVFGIGSAVPIMIIAWLLAYSVVSIGSINHKLQHFEKWFRYVCSVLFVACGIFMFLHEHLETHEEHQHEHHLEWLAPAEHHHEHDHCCEHHP